MGKFDEKYDVRRAEVYDIPSIMDFIGTYWSPGHIMSVDRAYFEYEFLTEEGVNFVIAVDRLTDSIQGIRGLLFSAADKEKRDMWGSIWKANSGGGNFPLLGTEIRKRTAAIFPFRYNLGVGQNMNTTRIAGGFFGKKIVRLKHFYRLNPEIREYKIAVINKPPILKAPGPGYKDTAFAVRLGSIEEVRDRIDIEAVDSVPYKDFWFIKHRYFDHPRYEYRLYALGKKGERASALMVMREVSIVGSRALRVIDYIGDQEPIAGLYVFFAEMLSEGQYEYVDFYEYGFDESFLKKAGFSERYEEGEENIIPNYFEPFVRENKELSGFMDSDINATIFKGDGDQDRPNIPERK